MFNYFTFCEIIKNLLVAFLASFFTWSFVKKYVKIRSRIVFSDYLEKSSITIRKEEKDINVYRYRVRLLNAGTNNLTEVNIVAKIGIQGEKTDKYNTTYLYVGDIDVTIPVIEAYDSKKGYIPHTYTIYMSPSAFQEYSKSFYDKEIRTKADKRLLTLDDILSKYGERTKMTIYVFGNDEETGIRRIFNSKEYTFRNRKNENGDVILGTFHDLENNVNKLSLWEKFFGNSEKNIDKLRTIISKIDNK